MSFRSKPLRFKPLLSPSPRSLLRAAALVAVLPLLAACDDRTPTAATAPRPVRVERIAYAPETAARDFAGVVRARHETDLGFRVAGKIVTRVINVGDRVHAGDVGAKLDPQDFKLQLESADAEVSAATSNLAQAAADWLRFENLKSRGYASVADFERKKAAKDEAEGRLERAQRSLELARNQLAYSDLKADADGVITATLAEPGQVVAIGQAVARLAHKGETEAVVALPETWLAAARDADATVRLWSGPNRGYAAHLRELSPQADAVTRTYTARFTIENPDDAVALGMTATVVLTKPADAMVARVPLAAILNRGAGPAVFLVDATGVLERRPVTVATFTDAVALVTSGLDDGDEIVTLGVHLLEAGQKVRAVVTQAIGSR
jgi:RND family efflux transporter MFP subunit